MVEPAPLIHENRGRNPRTIAALLTAVLVLAGLYSVGTLPWILIALGVFAIPALTDVLLNPKGRFELTATDIGWKNSGQTAHLPLSRIAEARFDTRWDFSVRVTLKLVDQSKLRIPQDVMPPHKNLEDALKERKIKTERHHFRVI